MIENFVYLGATIGLLLTLYFSSVEDMKYHRISKKYVLVFFIIVIFYNNFAGASVEKTLAFIITLVIFSCITFASKGMFGFGDTLIISAIAWFIGDLIYLQYFYLTLCFCSLVIGAYFVLVNHKQNHKGFKKIFNNTMFVDKDNLKPGMVLANDYFMKGLTEKEIDDLKKFNDGPVLIKQTYPFIPVIFASFLIYVIMYNIVF